jgi:carboxyl-terminal processing protease
MLRDGYKGVWRGRKRVLLALAGYVVSLGAMLAAPAEECCAELTAPTANDRRVTLVVTSLLRQKHLSKHALDDEISQRSMDTFIEMLDRLKVYFYQSDVDEFMAYRNELDDAAKRGDITFAYTVFNRFLERVDQRVAMVEELLDGEFDFTVKEDLVTDPDERAFPKDEQQARERWRKRIKYDLLILKTDKTEGQEARDKLRRRYRSFAKRMHQTNSDELLEMYLTSMTTSYDPHTTYMSPTSLTNFLILMRLQLEGIGAALKSEDGYTVVTRIIPGGAAYKEGTLKKEDRVISVGEGEDGEMVDIVDMKLSDVVKMIRGKAGTVVRLGVISQGATESKTVKITRAKIELKDSEAKGEIFEAGKRPDGKPFKIGVIDLPSFYMDMTAARFGRNGFKSTTADVHRILDDFTEKGVDAVVLDLRRNGGGSLTEAINLTGLFIDQGPVVQVKDSEGRVQHYDDRAGGMAWTGPLVVVTSKLSASASEILAGAIQDYRRGIVVGDDMTHGKGTVQSLLNLGEKLFEGYPNPPNLGALKITMQQFYRPKGESTQKRGVVADIELPALTTHMDIGEDDLDYAIEFDKIDPAMYDPLSFVDKSILKQLRARTAQRQKESEDFGKLLENIVRYREHKARKRVSLNEEEFFARRAELNAEEEEKKTLEEQDPDEDENRIERDFYLDEVIAIAVDYLSLLKGHQFAQVLR